MQKETNQGSDIVALKGKAMLQFNHSAKRFEIIVGSDVVDSTTNYPLALAMLEMNS